MRPARNPSGSRPRVITFVVYLAVVLSIVQGLFPPFVGLNGIEHAFVLTGPEWSRALGDGWRELGLMPRIHWVALGVQLGTLWAIALGARWILGDRAGDARDEPDLQARALGRSDK